MKYNQLKNICGKFIPREIRYKNMHLLVKYRKKRLLLLLFSFFFVYYNLLIFCHLIKGSNPIGEEKGTGLKIIPNKDL